MSKAEIFAGVCGFHSTVIAKGDGDAVQLTITSECEAIQRLGQNFTQVDPFREISFRRGNMPSSLAAGHLYCTHAACPVPVGIIKAIEVEAGLALPRDVEIKISAENE